MLEPCLGPFKPLDRFNGAILIGRIARKTAHFVDKCSR